MDVVPKPKSITRKTMDIHISKRKIAEVSKRLGMKINEVDSRLEQSFEDAKKQYFK